jgi:heat shock protein HslJ
MNRKVIVIVALLLIGLTACGGQQSSAPTQAPTQIPTAIPTEAMPEPTIVPTAANPATSLTKTLGNLSYTGLFPDKAITLKDGVGTYEGGGAVRLLDQLIAQGDVNGDGKADAVVLLDDEASGSGHFIWVAVVLDALGKPTPTEAIMLGDRIGVKSLKMDGAQVVADIVGQGTGDVACCGTWNIRKVFALQDSKLAEQSSKELSKVSLSDLNGSWRLVDLNSHQEPALPDVAVTLQIAEGQLSGSAGCNNYNSTVTGSADDPSAFKVGPIVSTKKACPDPIRSQETSYLTRLGQAKSWKYDAGQLAILYSSDNGSLQYLVFEPAAGRAQ